jgi:Asp-tRNA(Asn)/Glu-tRNA(Gln) amidotransferase A subunit family amidase
MNLAWTSDRGPICRSAEDCAMVFASIHGSDTYDRASRTMPLTIRIRLNLKPKVAYAKNYIDSLPDNSPEKLLSELCRMQVYKWWLLIFHPTYTNDLLLSIWYAESAAADLTRSGKDSQMIQQWQSRYPNVFRLHGLFRLLNTSPRAVCVTWLCSRLFHY